MPLLPKWSAPCPPSYLKKEKNICSVTNLMINLTINLRPTGVGALQYQMDMGVSIGLLPKAGAFGENTVSKNEGSLGQKPNFGSRLEGIGKECYFWSFSERFKSRNLQKKIVENGKNNLSYGGGLWVRAIEEPTFLQIMWGLWVTAKTISNMVIGWQQSVLKIGGLWAFRPTSALHPRTSIMGVPLHPGAYMNLSKFVNVTGRHHQESSSWQKLWNGMRMHVKIKLEISGQMQKILRSLHAFRPKLFSWSADILAFVAHESSWAHGFDSECLTAFNIIFITKTSAACTTVTTRKSR